MEAMTTLTNCIHVKKNKVFVKDGCHMVLSKGEHSILGHLKICGNNSVEGNVHIYERLGYVKCPHESTFT